jgi:hypothetical protein
MLIWHTNKTYSVFIKSLSVFMFCWPLIFGRWRCQCCFLLRFTVFSNFTSTVFRDTEAWIGISALRSFLVLTAVAIKFPFFWDVMLYSLVQTYQRLRETWMNGLVTKAARYHESPVQCYHGSHSRTQTCLELTLVRKPEDVINGGMTWPSGAVWLCLSL